MEQNIKDLVSGDHICCIFETEEEHRLLFTSFLRHGLEKREKVIYIVDIRTKEEILDYLRYEGLNVNLYLESGQLSILTTDDVYLRKGFFDPDSVIALLRNETARAIDEGYSALRMTGEMGWALKELPGSEKLIEYESMLNNFFPGSKCLAICQYDKKRFEPSLLLQILTTHPIAVIGTEICNNFYYLPPFGILGIDLEVSGLNKWLKNLSEHNRIDVSNERLHYLLFSSVAVIYTAKTSGDYKTTFISENVTGMTGYEPNEIVENPTFWFDHVYLDDKSKIADGIGRLFKEDLNNKVYRFCCKDGSYIWVYDGMRLIRDKNGEPLEIVGCRIDITERNGAQNVPNPPIGMDFKPHQMP